jgi:hypothetical protein
MLRRGMVMLMITAGVIGGFWLTQAISQQAPGGDEQQRDRFRQRREEFRQRAQEQMRKELGASEDEWKVLEPRIAKVRQFQAQTRVGFPGMGGFTGGGRRGRTERQPQEGAPAPEREQSEVEKKTEALRSLLRDEASSAGAIKGALDALRKAREQAQQELAAARKDLRELVNVRQEANLVLMVFLDL